MPKNNSYRVYYYLPKLPGASSSVSLNVFDGQKKHEVILDMKSFKVEGQTSGEWLYAGEYTFIKNRRPKITVMGKGDGVVVADAVILVAVK